MSKVLVTGASGFIGVALAKSLSRKHDVICLGRKNPQVELPWICGNFGCFEDLRKLDRQEIDAVVHLAAVTGACLEREGTLVNVEGTRCLMRYLIDHGCRKFVMASSTAAVGFQSKLFRPCQLPIPDEHPCLDRDGYGLSKFLMEEITRYYHRQNSGIDVINLRLSSIYPDQEVSAPVKMGPLEEWAVACITVMTLSDAVRAFTLALEAPHRAGIRILNAAAPTAWVADPVAKILRNWWGMDVDVSWFEQPGHEFDSVFDVRRIKAELGFVSQIKRE